MYCSASQRMDSASSTSVICGKLIFLTITALPDSEAATSRFFVPARANARRIASVALAASMIAPSTMLSGAMSSRAKATTRNDLPAAFSSTTLTALEPISSPTMLLFLPNTFGSCPFRGRLRPPVPPPAHPGLSGRPPDANHANSLKPHDMIAIGAPDAHNMA